MRALSIIALLLFACAAFGGVINVSSSSALNAANNDAVSGDTVKLAAGTYTVAIAPTSSGVTYMWATVGSVCSLYVTSGTAIVVDGFDSIKVIGIRAQTAWSVAGYAFDVTDADHFFMQHCRIYGGTSRSGQGDYTAFHILNAHYGRIYNCLFDRQDPVVANPSTDNQGDGLTWYESSHLIFEYDTVRNVSHAAWYGPGTRDGSSPPWAQLNGPVVMRNCVAYDSHNPYDLQNAGHTILMDGCKGWSPMVKSLDKGGHTLEYAIERSIIRYGMFYNDSVRTQTSGGMNDSPSGSFITMGDDGMMHMGPYAIRVYNNAFLAAPYAPPSYAWTLFISRQGNYDAPWGKSVYANNIISNPSDTNLINYNDRSLSMANAMDTLKGNLLWDGSPGGDVIDFEMSDGEKFTLAACIAENSAFMQASNIEASPLWVDSVIHIRGERSFEISGTSLAKDAGVALTRLRAGASSSTVLQVADSKYFWYAHSNPYDRGDSIAIRHAGAWTRCLVDSVDTSGNNIIVHAAVTLTAGDSVYLLAGYVSSTGTYTNRLSGLRPDIGPYEIAQGDGGGTVIPDTTANVAPTNGSTQAQPITFRWRTVTGATQYKLTASYDNWGHDHVNEITSDTSFVYSGFPLDTLVIWNVRAGNSAGWSDWTAVWSFQTQAAVSYGDTITVNWNNVFESETLTDNTVLQMANLQRRDNILVIKNPSGRLVDWPSNLRWPGLEVAPQPAAGDTVAYWLIRDGSLVYGFVLGSQAGTGGGVTAGWVTTQLINYLRIDQDATINGHITFTDSTFSVDTVRVATSPDLYIRPVSFGLHQYGYPTAKPTQWTDYHALDVRQYINGSNTGGLFGSYCIEGGTHFGGTDTLREGIGVYGLSQLTGSGRMLSAIGMMARVQGQAGASGTINTGYGLFVKQPAISGGTLSKYYGVYVEDGQNITDTLLWIGSGRSRLGGDVWIGGNINGTRYMVLDSGAEIARYGGYLLNYGELYLKKDISLVNKAGSGWLPFAHRDVSGAEAKYNIDNVGILSASGAVTFTSTLSVGSSGGYMQNYGDYYARAGIGLINKVGNSWLGFATRNTSGTEARFDLDYIGKIATRTNTGTTTVDSIKVSGGNLLFYVGGTAYKAVP